MIREAELRDLDDIINLLHQVLDVHYDALPHLFKENSVKYSKDELEKIIKEEIIKIFVFCLDDKVVGHLFCLIQDEKETNNQKTRRFLFIDDLCVDYQYRHQGIGDKLFNYAKDYAIKNKCDSILLNVYSKNINALCFYEKMGMNELKRTYEFKINKED